MENDNPLVSVCMPAYNAGKYVAQAVNSVLGQSYQNIELIIVNDGSTDDTAAIVSTIADERLTVVHQQNKGQCAAANAAFNTAKGSLIKFMDADDILSPGFIENQVKRIGNRNNAVVSAAWGRFYNDDLNTFKLTPEEQWEQLTVDEWLVKAWRHGSSMMQCALWLIPREVLKVSGLWDETLSLVNDFDFFTRVVLAADEVLFAKDAILYYRSGIAGSLSDSKSDTAAASAFRSIDQGTANLLKVRDDDAAKLACANTWQQLAYTLYPQHKRLTALAEARIANLTKPDIVYAKAGLSALLLKVFNWKTVKNLKAILN